MRLTKGVQLFSVVLLLGATLAIDLVPPVSAKPTQANLIARSRRRRLTFRTGVRPSRYRVGGYSRSSQPVECTTKQLIALVPPKQDHENISKNNEAVDKTSVDRPAFFVYVPPLPPTKAQFTLQEEDPKAGKFYEVEFKLTGKPGIVGIVLPDSVPALKVGQKYFWQVGVMCDPEQRSLTGEDPIVSSWIERVSAPVSGGDDRLATLAEQGIWQDVITLVGLQRFQKPKDPAIAADWAALMQDGGMSEYQQAEIIQIVKN